MSNISKKIEKKKIENDPYIMIMDMGRYVEVEDYNEILKKLHIDYGTGLYIKKYRREYVKEVEYGSCILKEIRNVYNTCKKGNTKYITKTEMIKAVIDKATNTKKQHFINPISSYQLYGCNRMTLRYVIGLWWLQSGNASKLELITEKEIEEELERMYDNFYMDLVRRLDEVYKDEDTFTQSYDNKLKLLVNAFNKIHHTDVLQLVKCKDYKDASHSALTFLCILIAYLYGVNTTFLLGSSDSPCLFVDVTGSNFQEEHIRMKLLKLYESGYITDLYKTDKEIDRFLYNLNKAPTNNLALGYRDLLYFVEKYGFSLDALTGKYKPIRDDMPAVSTMELKESLRYYDQFIKDLK